MTRSPQKTILLLAILLAGMATTFYLGAAGPGTLGAVTRRAAAPPDPLITSGMAVFFTDPGRESLRGGPESGLIAAIDAARIQVDVAAYDLTLWSLRDALLAAHRRGVVVRLVVEAEQLTRAEIQALADGGIPLVSDRADGLMHNKFVIVDRRQVWTGSMNFTLNGAYRNDNSLLAITSAEAAAAYRREFEEMFVDGLFGAYSPPGSPSRVEIAGGDGGKIPIEIYFSPDDGAASRVIDLIEAARSSVQFMVFSFTSDAIGEAMLARAAAGVVVRGVFDESQLGANRGGEYERLLNAGLDVRIDGSPDKLHHKVIIIDRRIVVLGSYNFSASAEARNDENMLVIEDETLAAVFLEEWGRIFENGK